MNSIARFQLPSLPFYWRLKANGENTPVPERMPFSVSFDTYGLLREDRQPELLSTLERIYSLDANIGYLQEGYEIARPYLEDFWSYIEQEISGAEHPLRILEIGCGGAVLLARLKDLGHQVLGIDPSPLSTRASKTLEIDIVPTMLERNLDIGSFDLIFSMDVLEHAFDPDDFVAISLGYLKDDGRMIYSVPDAGPSIDFGEVSFAMHQHLQYFTQPTLLDLLERSGLSSVQVSKSNYGGSLYAVGRLHSGRTMQENDFLAQINQEVPPGRAIEIMQANHQKVSNYLDSLATSGRSIGCYAPLRALPYVCSLDTAVVEEQFRFIDDTEPWQGKFFDGFDIPIFGISKYTSDPPTEIVIFSLTFENAIVSRLKGIGLESKITTLREIVER